MENAIRSKLKQFIVENFMFGKGEVADDQSLFDEGIIDSFGVVVLLSYIEKEFNIHFDRSEITMDSFETVGRIASNIRDKLKDKNKG